MPSTKLSDDDLTDGEWNAFFCCEAINRTGRVSHKKSAGDEVTGARK